MIESSRAFREAAHLGRLAFLNQVPNPAKLYFFGGDRASGIDAPASSAPLCIITLATPAGTVTAGVLSLAQFEDGLILSGGEATWCRLFRGDGAACFDMDVGVEGSGAEAIVASATLLAGGLLRLLSCNLG